MTSSSSYLSTLSGTFLANVIETTFLLTTQPDLIFPSFSGVVSGTTYTEPVSITFEDTNLYLKLWLPLQLAILLQKQLMKT